MSRSKRGYDPVAWLMGLGVPGLLLVGVFSTLPYERMMGGGALRIKADEVAWFRSFFDLRAGSDSVEHAETYHFPTRALAEIDDARWHTTRFTADGWKGNVDVRRMRTTEGGWVIKFPKDTLFHTQRQVTLRPADVGSIRDKYEEILAGELGLIAPEVTFVRVTDGERIGLFVKEERIDAGFLEKRRITDGALFSIGFLDAADRTLFAEVEDDTLVAPVLSTRLYATPAIEAIEPRDAAALLLMAAVADRWDLLANDALFAYRWTTGRIVPLYRSRREAPTARCPVRLTGLFAELLREPRFRTALANEREALLERAWRLKERFAAMDQAWLPVLAGGGSLGMAQAEADAIKAELLDPANTLVLLEMAIADGSVIPVPFADAIMEHITFDRRVLASRLGGEWIGDSLVLRRGTHEVRENLVLPKGAALILDKSARLELAPGATLLVQGPLIARGTGVNPVFVRALVEDSAYGALAVSMEGGRCDLRGLRISGGSEARINGFYHSGMLSIHGASAVYMEGCTVGGNHGEDALNIKRGHAIIRDCVFEDAHADLVDLDFVKGEVRDCVFRNGRDDSNGDGLDLSGAHVLVRGCTFTRMLDKGMSIGEVSEALVIDCAFEANRLGMAVKDLSIAHVDACVFRDNSTVFGVYRKKPIHGGARLLLYANEFTGNTHDREVDEHSLVLQENTLDPKVKAAFGLAR